MVSQQRMYDIYTLLSSTRLSQWVLLASHWTNGKQTAQRNAFSVLASDYKATFVGGQHHCIDTMKIWLMNCERIVCCPSKGQSCPRSCYIPIVRSYMIPSASLLRHHVRQQKK